MTQARAEPMPWPDPWAQLNAKYEPGSTPNDLVAEDVLYRECARIIRAKSAIHTAAGK